MELRLRRIGNVEKIPFPRSSPSTGNEMESETTPGCSNEGSDQQEGRCITGNHAKGVADGHDGESRTTGDDIWWGSEKNEQIVAPQRSDGTLQSGESRPPM